MLGLFEALKKQYDKQESCMLAVVVEANGSTPREAGAYMLVNQSGRVWGTIGGGDTEYEAQGLAQKQLLLKQNQICSFNLIPTENKMCGGSQKILLHFVDMESLEARQNIALLLQVAGGNENFWLEIPHAGGLFRISIGKPPRFNDGDDGEYYREQFNYDGIVYICGGGHVAQALVPLLSSLDFQCVVVDDRAEFADLKLFPNAKKSFPVDYNCLENFLQFNANDYVCIMTRAHTYDAECERFALRTEAGYIGVMGSKHKAALTKAKLLAEGFTEQEIARVITPIGISLPCETPMEIAVSIAAQLIEVRAKRYK